MTGDHLYRITGEGETTLSEAVGQAGRDETECSPTRLLI